MERLTGQDAGFLYNETPTQHMHTLKIAVLDVSEFPGGYSFDVVKDVLGARLHLLPPFRRRIVEVPLHLSHPWWVEDPDFDLDRHLHRVVLPSPGTREQFDAEISRIASIPLDRARPLWEIHVVEGLADGRVAFVAKIHHCAADGVMAAELLANVMEVDPTRTEPPPEEQPWSPDPIPTRIELLRLALRDIVQVVLGLPALLVRTVRGLVRVGRHRRAGGPRPAVPFTGAKTFFNRSLTEHRRFVTATLPLGRVKAVKSAYGVTVNDIVLALCTGALRRYLSERGELPSKPLVAGVPVSTRATDRPLRANSVSNLFVSLPVHVDEPVARVRTINDSTRGAKEQHNLLGVDMLADWSELTPGKPYGALIRWYSRANLADKGPPPINLIVSNVPGPREPLYIAGVPLTAIYSMGPILEGIGLNVTVWSYLDDLNAGVVACPEVIPDLGHLVDLFEFALEELEAAAPVTAAQPNQR